MSRGFLPLRALRKLFREGPMEVLRALKWKFYRHKDLIVCERALDLPIQEPPRLILPEGLVVTLATLDDLDSLAANFPMKREWYRQRLETPGYYCTIARLDGAVLAQQWFCTCPHYDPEMRCLIEPGPREAYCFEGWCLPERRGFGVSHLGMKHCIEEVLPGRDVDRVFTMLEAGNRPTRRFHARYGFQDVGRKRHLRIGPFCFNSKIKPLLPRSEATTG